jgi:hypothetical protein
MFAFKLRIFRRLSAQKNALDAMATGACDELKVRQVT